MWTFWALSLATFAAAVAFALRGLDLAWTAGAAALLVIAAIPILRWLWPHVEAPMRGPVAAYIVVITAMVALAAGTFGAHGNPWIAKVGIIVQPIVEMALAFLCLFRGQFERAKGCGSILASHVTSAFTIGLPRAFSDGDFHGSNLVRRRSYEDM